MSVKPAVKEPTPHDISVSLLAVLADIGKHRAAQVNQDIDEESDRIIREKVEEVHAVLKGILDVTRYPFIRQSDIMALLTAYQQKHKNKQSVEQR